MPTETTVDAPRTVHAPIDPNVKLPTGVLAGLAKAEAAHKAAYNPDPAAPAAPADPAAPVAAQPAPQPAPVAPQVPSVDTLAQYGQQPQPQPQPDPAAGDDGSWEHKFKSEHGRTSAMARTMQDMQQQMMALGNELVAAQQTIANLQRQPAPQPQQRQSLITDKDRTDFGEDFLNVAARAAQDALLPEVMAARQEAQQTRQELHEMKVGRVYDALAQQVGHNWRDVNRHPRFNAWLALRDPLSGVIRKQLLNGAMQAADAARVVTIFNGFLTEDAAFRPAAPATPQPTLAPGQPAPGQRQPAVSLETIAAPGRASGAPGSPAATAKPTYTNRDMDRFYDDVRRGKFAGRDAEKMAIETDMHTAQFDGRFKRV